MNTVVRQDPWSLVPRLQDEINRLFSTANQNDSSSATATWVPAVDIHEYGDRFEIYLDLPGVDPKDVDLTLESGVLTLSGRRQDNADRNSSETTQSRRIERGQGVFYRRFLLPESVDSDRVNASGRHGVLTVTIPKQAKALPRRIQIAA